jgi:hypothetical protein
MQTLQDGEATRETAPVFTWTFPGAPVAIQVHYEVIAQLSRSTFREGGGLLFGTRSRGVLEIRGCEPATAGEGDLYDAIVHAKERSVHPSGSSELIILGYYRTHNRDRLEIEKQDVETIKRAFQEKEDVILLIKSDASGPAMATFFFPTAVDMLYGLPFLEFPLDPAALPMRPKVQKNSKSSRIAPGPDLRLSTITPQVQEQETIPDRAELAKPDQVFTPVSAPSQIAAKAEALSRTMNWGRGSWMLRFGLGGALAVIGLAFMFRSHGGVSIPVPVSQGKRDQNQIQPQVRGESAVAPAVRPDLPMHRSPETVGDASRSLVPLGSGPPLARSPASGSVVQSQQPATSDARAATAVRAPMQTFRPPVRQGGQANEQAGAQELFSPDAVSPRVDPAESNQVTTSPFTQPQPLPPPRVGSSRESSTVPTPAAGAGASESAAPATGSSATLSKVNPVTDSRLIRQTQPTVPRNLLNLLSKEVVISVRVQIDASGNVVQATSETPNSASFSGYLTASALAAAKSWKFEPAKIGTHNVPSEKVVEFRFSPPRP